MPHDDEFDQRTVYANRECYEEYDPIPKPGEMAVLSIAVLLVVAILFLYF